MAEFKHTYAGNPYDRGETLRRSEETIADLQGKNSSLFLPFHKLNVSIHALPTIKSKNNYTRIKESQQL